MGKCKTKAIQRDLGTFRHNQAYPGIIQAYSGIFRTLYNPAIFTTVVQNQKHIQSPGIFRTPTYSKPEADLIGDKISHFSTILFFLLIAFPITHFCLTNFPTKYWHEYEKLFSKLFISVMFC